MDGWRVLGAGRAGVGTTHHGVYISAISRWRVDVGHCVN